MEYIGIILGSVALAVAIAVAVTLTVISKRKRKWIDREDFIREKRKISSNCTEENLDQFRKFLMEYKGGYIRRAGGKIIHQNFLGRELGDLKGIFYGAVVPASDISIKAKERFRKYLLDIGVTGIERRPNYELRPGKLGFDQSDMEDANQYRIKAVGNEGEQAVRDILSRLDSNRFKVINGVVLMDGHRTKEYDHIVVGGNEIFILETKAFGASFESGVNDNACLYINDGDQWVLKKNNKYKNLKSPSNQIMGQKFFLEKLLQGFHISVRPILVLSNNRIRFHDNIKHEYEIIKKQDLLSFFDNRNFVRRRTDIQSIITTIDTYRIN